MREHKSGEKLSPNCVEGVTLEDRSNRGRGDLAAQDQPAASFLRFLAFSLFVSSSCHSPSNVIRLSNNPVSKPRAVFPSHSSMLTQSVAPAAVVLA